MRRGKQKLLTLNKRLVINTLPRTATVRGIDDINKFRLFEIPIHLETRMVHVKVLGNRKIGKRLNIHEHVFMRTVQYSRCAAPLFAADEGRLMNCTN